MPASSLVLFDIDGTLLRTAGAHHREALAAGIRDVMDLETTLEGVSTSGMLDRDLIRIMLTNAGVAERRIARAMKPIVHAAHTHYTANCAVDLSDRVCSGVRPCLAKLREAGAALGLVTGNLSPIAWRKMELAQLREFFSFGAFAEDGSTRALLARRAFHRAVRSGLIIRSARVSLIGDHGNDVGAAKANKFLSVAVATGLISYEDLRQHQPDILVHDLNELDISLLL